MAIKEFKWILRILFLKSEVKLIGAFWSFIHLTLDLYDLDFLHSLVFVCGHSEGVWFHSFNRKIRNCLTSATQHCFSNCSVDCILHSVFEYGMFGAKYVRKEQIGQGAFGKAYKAISKERKGVYVVKEVSGLNKREIESAKNEVKILRKVHHDYVVEDIWTR